MSSGKPAGFGVGHSVHLSREPRKDCERAVRPGKRRRAPGRLAGAGYRAFYQPGPRVGGRSHGGDQRPHRRPPLSRSRGRLKGPERRRHVQRNDATLCCGRLVSRHVHIPSSNQNIHVYTYINIAQVSMSIYIISTRGHVALLLFPVVRDDTGRRFFLHTPCKNDTSTIVTTPIVTSLCPST